MNGTKQGFEAKMKDRTDQEPEQKNRTIVYRRTGMDELADEGCAEDVRKHTADGYFSAEAHWPDGDPVSEAKLSSAVRTVAAGLAAVEALYPENVQLND